jgi:hypothetical protein
VRAITASDSASRKADMALAEASSKAWTRS